MTVGAGAEQRGGVGAPLVGVHGAGALDGHLERGADLGIELGQGGVQLGDRNPDRVGAHAVELLAVLQRRDRRRARRRRRRSGGPWAPPRRRRPRRGAAPTRSWAAVSVRPRRSIRDIAKLVITSIVADRCTRMKIDWASTASERPDTARMQWDLWLAFVGASIAISVSPGAGAIQSMATGLTHGLRRGYWSIAGLQIGLMTQLAVVAVGLGAAVAKSVLAFTVIKWIGVVYLVYLAVRQWRTTPSDLSEQLDAGNERRPVRPAGPRLSGQRDQPQGPGVPARRRCRSSWCPPRRCCRST